MGVTPASGLKLLPDGQPAHISGFVISRQRPGTAKGFFFLSIEDETGVSRTIINPDLFEKHRALLSHGKFLQIAGTVQTQDNGFSVKAFDEMTLAISAVPVQSHDFH
jgi:error-prone DNA polymerase